MADKYFVFAVLGMALVLFAYGKWRYDIVALAALLTLTAANIIPVDQAFAGLRHPAVITVAAVLVMSTSLQNACALDILAKWMDKVGPSQTVQLLGLMGWSSYRLPSSSTLGRWPRSCRWPSGSRARTADHHPRI